VRGAPATDSPGLSHPRCAAAAPRRCAGSLEAAGIAHESCPCLKAQSCFACFLRESVWLSSFSLPSACVTRNAFERIGGTLTGCASGAVVCAFSSAVGRHVFISLYFFLRVRGRMAFSTTLRGEPRRARSVAPPSGCALAPRANGSQRFSLLLLAVMLHGTAAQLLPCELWATIVQPANGIWSSPSPTTLCP
jgi:hypothetical protein